MKYFFDNLRKDNPQILHTSNRSHPFLSDDILPYDSFNPNQIEYRENIGKKENFGLKIEELGIHKEDFQIQKRSNSRKKLFQTYNLDTVGYEKRSIETICKETFPNKREKQGFGLKILDNIITREYSQRVNLSDAFDVIRETPYRASQKSQPQEEQSMTPEKGRRIIRDVLEEVIARHYEGEVQVTDEKEIEAGRNDNRVFTYTVNGKPKKAFVKQIHYKGKNAQLRFRSELHLQQGLYNLGVSLAKPISAIELDDRGVIVQEYVPGETLDTIAAKLTYVQKVDLIASVVRELAKFQAKATLYTQELRELSGITQIVDQNQAYFEYSVQRDHTRLTQGKTSLPQQLIDAGLQSVAGTRRYAAHTDFNPWNVMLRDDSQIMLLDFEEIALPSKDGTQGYFLGHDLANVLSWPQFQLGPIAQRDVVDLFIKEFHKTLTQERIVDLKKYKALQVDENDFKNRLRHAQMYMAHWVAGIEANEGWKGNPQRLVQAKVSLGTINTNEKVLGYTQRDYRIVA